MEHPISKLLLDVMAREARNRRIALVLIGTTAACGAAVIAVSVALYPPGIALGACALVVACLAAVFRDAVRPLSVSAAEAALLLDRTLPTGDRVGALLHLQASTDQGGGPHAQLIAHQLSAILVSAPPAQEIAPLTLSPSERRARILTPLLAAVFLLLVTFRPVPPQ